VETVRKHPRTLQQAFGPYTSNVITEERGPINWWAWAVFAAVAIGALVWIL
jgi:hypothetical protein